MTVKGVAHVHMNNVHMDIFMCTLRVVFILGDAYLTVFVAFCFAVQFLCSCTRWLGSHVP